MKYTENDYIQAGYKFERGRMTLARLEQMVAKENPADRFLALSLFNRGRMEARQ
jgi:hypothetical protein